MAWSDFSWDTNCPTFLSFSTAQTHAMIAHRMQSCHLPSTSFYIQDSFYCLTLNHIKLLSSDGPGSQDCIVAMGWMIWHLTSGRSEMYSLGLVPAQLPLHWVVEVKNERSYTSTPLMFWVLARLQRPNYCLLI